jgi:hypothetical protein
MKTFVFEPLRGIRGSVQFGMSREEVRAVLAPESPAPFSRGGTSVDAFYEACLQVSYDTHGKVEFIEFARGLAVLLDGFDVLGSEAATAIDHLKKQHELDAESTEPGYTFQFLDIELGLWRPVLPEEGSSEGLYFESAGFGRAGYYRKRGQPDGTDNSGASPLRV